MPLSCTWKTLSVADVTQYPSLPNKNADPISSKMRYGHGSRSGSDILCVYLLLV